MRLLKLMNEIESYMEKEGLTDSDSIYDLLLSIENKLTPEDWAIEEALKNLREAGEYLKETRGILKEIRDIPIGKYNREFTRLGEIKEEDDE